jgi:ketosteroid isomerase-like protein
MEDNKMKNKHRHIIFPLFVIVLGFGFTSLRAQEWSPAQKDIWKNVNDYWSLLAKGDIDGFASYIHADYVGWDNESVLPGTKEEGKKWLDFGKQGGEKILLYEIKPLTIKIYGDVAFVHYYYTMIKQNGEGKKSPEAGRWTDILLKQGNKWMMIGDHGGKEDK